MNDISAEDVDGLYWGQPFRARKWHIFEDGTSLCGNWMYNATQPVIIEDEVDSDSDCVQCCRKAGYDI